MDEIFQRSGASQKRKLEDPTASFAHHSSNKSAKKQNGASARGSLNSEFLERNKAATVQDEVEDEEDTEAGPALPPTDIDEDDGEDEEGRFFGGGVSKREQNVLDFIDTNEGEEEEVIDLTWLKRTAVNFERKINKNAELRAKYEDEPLKFVVSEADLDGEIKSLSLLNEHADLYPDFVRSGCAASLVNLLAHENTDIAISVCEVISELTDEDSGASEEQWNILVRELLKTDIVGLLISNLKRLDEKSETDRSGVYHVLNVMENLLSNTENSERLGDGGKLLDWLLKRVSTPDTDSRSNVGQNRQYAAEILAILLQSNDRNRTRLSEANGADVLLQLLSIWRRKDPEKESNEEEFAENLFDCLISLVRNPSGADSFLEGEGVELCLIMLKEGGFSKIGALRVLDHGASGVRGLAVSERIVEAGGLKAIFTTFMKTKKTEKEIVEHLIGLMASMLKFLPGESPARIRTLAKFIEKDYEKTLRLVEIRKEYAQRINAVDQVIAGQKRQLSTDEIDDMEVEWLSRRMDAGLFSLQTLDVILAWLIAEDRGVHEKLIKLMGSYEQKIRGSLQQQLGEIDVDDSETSRTAKEMLEALLECLK